MTSENTFDLVRPSVDSVLQKRSIQKPPYIENTYSEYYVVIDSRSRDTQKYPNQNTYSINLLHNITEVVEITLLKADIPFSQYKINDRNNKLRFVWDGTTYNIQIRKGDYYASPPEVFLSTELQNKMNKAIGVSTDNPDINVAYDSLNDKIVFKNEASSPKPSFKIITGSNNDYLENSIGKTLGFKPDTYIMNPSGTTTKEGDDVSYYIIPPYVHQFEKENYILLDLKAGGQKTNVIQSADDSIQDSFALIDNNDSEKSRSEIKYIGKIFPNTINTLNRLEFTFKNYDGTLYDFHNKDHKLEFLIKTHKQGQRNTNEISFSQN